MQSPLSGGSLSSPSPSPPPHPIPSPVSPSRSSIAVPPPRPTTVTHKAGLGGSDASSDLSELSSDEAEQGDHDLPGEDQDHDSSTDSSEDQTFRVNGARVSKRAREGSAKRSNKSKPTSSPTKSKSKSKSKAKARPTKPKSQSQPLSHSRQRSSNASLSSSAPVPSSSIPGSHANGIDHAANYAAFLASTNDSDDENGGRRSSRRSKRRVVPGPMWDWVYKKMPSNSSSKKEKNSSNGDSESPARDIPDDKANVRDGVNLCDDPNVASRHTPHASDPSHDMDEDVKPDIEALNGSVNHESASGQHQNNSDHGTSSITAVQPARLSESLAPVDQGPTQPMSNPPQPKTRSTSIPDDPHMLHQPNPIIISNGPVVDPSISNHVNSEPITVIIPNATDLPVEPVPTSSLDVLASFAAGLGSTVPRSDSSTEVKNEEVNHIEAHDNPINGFNDVDEPESEDDEREDDQEGEDPAEADDQEQAHKVDQGEDEQPDGDDQEDDLEDEADEAEEKAVTNPDEELDIEELDQELEGGGDVDADPEVDPIGDENENDDQGEAEMETETEIQPTKRAEALDILAQMELKFAMLRTRIFMDKMEEIAQEEAMILDGTHPEHLHLLGELQRRRDRKLQLATLKRDREEEFGHQKRRSDEAMVWSWWNERRDDIRDELVREANAKRRKLEREKRGIDHPKSMRSIPLATSLQSRTPPPMSLKDTLRLHTTHFQRYRHAFLQSRQTPILAALSPAELALDLDALNTTTAFPRSRNSQHQQPPPLPPPAQHSPYLPPPPTAFGQSPSQAPYSQQSYNPGGSGHSNRYPPSSNYGPVIESSYLAYNGPPQPPMNPYPGEGYGGYHPQPTTTQNQHPSHQQSYPSSTSAQHYPPPQSSHSYQQAGGLHHPQPQHQLQHYPPRMHRSVSPQPLPPRPPSGSYVTNRDGWGANGNSGYTGNGSRERVVIDLTAEEDHNGFASSQGQRQPPHPSSSSDERPPTRASAHSQHPTPAPSFSPAQGIRTPPSLPSIAQIQRDQLSAPSRPPTASNSLPSLNGTTLPPLTSALSQLPLPPSPPKHTALGTPYISPLKPILSPPPASSLSSKTTGAISTPPVPQRQSQSPLLIKPTPAALGQVFTPPALMSGVAPTGTTGPAGALSNSSSSSLPNPSIYGQGLAKMLFPSAPIPQSSPERTQAEGTSGLV